MRKEDLARHREILASSRRQRPANPPIEDSITYNFENVAEIEHAMAGELPAYLRLGGNATVKLLEHKLALWEHGDKALVTSSGMSAITLTALTAFHGAMRGDEAVLLTPAYGGTWEFFRNTLPQFGYKTIFIPAHRTSWSTQLREALNTSTRLILFEPLTNPSVDFIDTQKLARIVRRHAPQALVVADNTFASSYNIRPLELGADAVVISATKYHNGFSDVLAGAIVAGTNLMEQKLYLWDRLRTYFKLFGPVLGVQDAAKILKGLETYGVRMAQHNRNAMRLAQWLAHHPLVECVRYPGLSTHPGFQVATQQMRSPFGGKGFGGVLSFRIQGGALDRDAFLNSFPFTGNTLVRHAPSLGSTKTMLQAAALMSHAGVYSEERHASGIHDCDIRVTVGIEEPFELILEDFKTGLENTRRVSVK